MTEQGEPIQVDESTYVIPVTRSSLSGNTVTEGVFTVHDGKTTWTPAIDRSLLARIGVTTGLIAATFATLAMVRQPPWPQIIVHEGNDPDGHGNRFDGSNSRLLRHW